LNYIDRDLKVGISGAFFEKEKSGVLDCFVVNLKGKGGRNKWTL